MPGEWASTGSKARTLADTDAAAGRLTSAVAGPAPGTGRPALGGWYLATLGAAVGVKPSSSLSAEKSRPRAAAPAAPASCVAAAHRLGCELLLQERYLSASEYKMGKKEGYTT